MIDSCLGVKNASSGVTHVCIILLAGDYWCARDGDGMELYQPTVCSTIDTLLAQNFFKFELCTVGR
jgi:hypothetical protein